MTRSRQGPSGTVWHGAGSQELPDRHASLTQHATGRLAIGEVGITNVGRATVGGRAGGGASERDNCDVSADRVAR